MSIVLVFYPLVLSFDSLFGFVLVAGENVSAHTHVFSTCSSLILYRPFKYVLIVINSDFMVFRR